MPTAASSTARAKADRDIGALDDNALLQACRNGDTAAWQQVVEKYERLIYAIPLRMGLSRADADDIFQLTFSTLAQNLDVIRDAAKMGGWLATVARRNAWAVLRNQRGELTFADVQADRQPGEADTLLDTATALGAPENNVTEQWEMSLWLDTGLRQLGERCRELLQSLYLDPNEPSYAEIVQRLGIPLGSIGPTRARCLEQLKQKLQGNA